MKSFYLCLMAVCALAFAGCSKEENSLAEENITADEIAKYEADLAAVTGDDAYDDIGDDDGSDSE